MVVVVYVYFSDFLYTDSVDEDATVMPSPEFLKGKILVKAKKLPPGNTEDDEVDLNSDSSDNEEEVTSTDGKKSRKRKNASTVSYVLTFVGFLNLIYLDLFLAENLSKSL